MNQTNVLLLYGGESQEHNISIVSATNVANAINPELFDVSYCYIDRDGRWWLTDSVSNDVSKNVELLPKLGTGSFIAGDAVMTPDVIVAILHGKNGEDGAVQALAELLHIPIVGCDMTSSAIAMNKVATKQIVKQSGINVVPYMTHRGKESLKSYGEITKELGEVLFVKPVNAGSSVGVSKARNEQEFHDALKEAHTHSELVLIEKAINGRELEVAVLGNFPTLKASVVGEIKPDGEFYSYESKYDQGSVTEAVIPAEIADDLSEKICKMAIQVFEALGCRGMARVDFFVDRDDGTIYLNEINTIPGFTDISMYPKLWEHGGVSNQDLVQNLIELALASKIKE